MFESIAMPFIILATLWRGFLSGEGSDSIYVCGAESKESVLARSLSQTQLETLYVDSMKLLALDKRARIRGTGSPAGTEIPDQFAFLSARRMEIHSADAHSSVSFHLKGCMDEHIFLTVDRKEIVLSYSTGCAACLGEEILWTANKESLLKAASSRAAKEKVVTVSFEFPGKPPVHVGITQSEVGQLTGVKHYPFEVEYWVRGALSKADMRYAADSYQGNLSITSVSGVWNGRAGTWVYFVDGVRSNQAINTLISPNVQTVRFVFE